MKFSLILLLLFSSGIRSSEESLLAVFHDQFDAFNQGDVERLVNNVSDDFKWYSLTSDKLLTETSGKSDFKKSMQSYYQTRKFNSQSVVESFTIDKNRISFKEIVSHKDKEGKLITSSAIGIYEINNGKIVRAWYFID